MKTVSKIAASAIVLVLATEIGLRSIWGFGNPAMLEKDPAMGYLFQAKQNVLRFGRSIKINSYHQRSDEVDALPRPGILRILFVGDSVTFGGAPIDQKEIFSELIKNRLQDKGRVEILNASAGGWGIGNEEAYLEKYHTFGSNLVVLEIGSHDLLQEKNGSQDIGVDPSMPDSRPFSAISELLLRYVEPRLITSANPSPTPDTSNPAQSYAQNMKWLGEEIAMARKAGARVVILHMPDRDEVVAPPEGYETKYEAWRERFLRLCREQNVPVLNMIAIWKADRNALQYFRDEKHLSVAGNKAVADQFLPFFESLGLPLSKD